MVVRVKLKKKKKERETTYHINIYIEAGIMKKNNTSRYQIKLTNNTERLARIGILESAT